MKLLYPILAVAGAFTFSSCAIDSPVSSNGGVAKYRSYDLPASLPSNPSNVRVKVSLSKQLTYVMEGSKPLLVMPVSIGTSKTPTPKGNFSIYYKDADRRAVSHGFAIKGEQVSSYSKKKSAPAGARKIGTPMPYWSEFKAGYGFHTGWLKPYPCTHGCVRMHENLAPKFFRLVKSGTPVNISHSQPEDATLGANIPRPIDAAPLPDYPFSYKISDKIFTHHKTPTYN